MLVLALDTTTRSGSHALVRDGAAIAQGVGDVNRTHAERLPGDVLGLLAGQGLGLGDVDLFAVATGPGSFTGLRIGIAAMQGLAFAAGRPIIGVSALHALARSALPHLPVAAGHVGVWMDGQRGEIFAALFVARRTGDGPVTLEPDGEAVVGLPGDLASRWVERGVGGAVFTGDGALRYRDAVEGLAGLAALVVDPVPPIAGDVAWLATQRFQGGGTFHPHAIVPVYVRRPDVELARDRRAGRHG
ncbi:MAG: tRNA (adenosine(37)-N6)-threonylcarbamoyltransferase complex dimerization subunit type 1 TsaB [Vicinamibacterales bacterium]|nr:tRNA (adenosine(37)-N6)-threonylcarbamoyltransferase complex dimerization subunit type 1 TsaB [Vicinamibacterales bacterium]